MNIYCVSTCLTTGIVDSDVVDKEDTFYLKKETAIAAFDALVEQFDSDENYCLMNRAEEDWGKLFYGNEHGDFTYVSIREIYVDEN